MTFKQPVYPSYFADPFVWRHEGIYYAVGTGVLEARSEAEQGGGILTADGKPGVFLILRSSDLTSWVPVGGALEALPPDYGNAYWAPEVAYGQGTFYLYYSVGREDRGHHLRVATASRPEGPYVDTGHRLTDPFKCPFAIDASPFQDDDGQWYLFFARDFLDATGDARPGTAVVADRLIGMTALAGEERVVLRASHDWQRFQADRVMYGSTFDWHTIEGPCVRKRDGVYYCFYSAGRWENESYGVDYATSDSVLGPYSAGDNGSGPRVLKTLPGHLIGPGHNSIIAGPDGATDYLIYHAWDAAMTARRMFITPVEWTGEGPRCAEPLAN